MIEDVESAKAKKTALYNTIFTFSMCFNVTYFITILPMHGTINEVYLIVCMILAALNAILSYSIGE